jgi:hypothetical protein
LIEEGREKALLRESTSRGRTVGELKITKQLKNNLTT